ncbi:hypothetical protein ACQ4M3_08125 [Leptolyngbya sp. AN03gr2]|uniref:hypothetical protein n=1 Tax=unclassified Leptolyngbya TaxID=2650499 RepID=UPI003D321CD9
MNSTPNFSNLGLTTQSVNVLYVMGCTTNLLDLAEQYADATGDETVLLDLDCIGSNLTQAGGSDNSELELIVSTAITGGFKAVVLTA